MIKDLIKYFFKTGHPRAIWDPNLIMTRNAHPAWNPPELNSMIHAKAVRIARHQLFRHKATRSATGAPQRQQSRTFISHRIVSFMFSSPPLAAIGHCYRDSCDCRITDIRVVSRVIDWIARLLAEQDVSWCIIVILCRSILPDRLGSQASGK